MRKFAIIDVETTGNGINGNRITEICIVVLQEDKVIHKFTSLVNPERNIPAFITGLTGIDNDMVRDAPKFFEIAQEIVELTEGAIFIAHNVTFDYNVVRGEFKRLGYTYTRKKLCTVRLSRKLIPGMHSYSLGKLCTSLAIPLSNRHRAEGDTDATVLLFQKLLDIDKDQETITSFLNARSKEATLPPHINKKQIADLPEQTGIYFFKNQKGKVIYVGKAKNIKQRVLSHFYDKKNKEYALGQHTYSIDYELTGNELIALLAEAEQIQKLYPRFNKAQKKPVAPYRIISYTNRRGVMQLVIDRMPSTNNAVEIFYTRADAVLRLEQLCTKYQLCPRYCNLQSTTEKCSHYKIKYCLGICEQKESVALYNIRVQRALAALQKEQQNYIIKEKGRTQEEESFILVKNGLYRGFGFITQDDTIEHHDQFENYLQPRNHTYHTAKILKSYLMNKAKDNVVFMEV
ncbi:exonuclease domain-containing protein [Aquimarina sp. ERC-38]|uniref:exonuclease domain-containing protein n=1 Tax=Aquimarina sp. ERC-38 TaxID=2949996 RepID=UPI002245C47F|nr:exonuclease domain-containing protein [Aquimarina sp. ERC-38]UZO80085.1 exonuclease domain-containing protein [Aquimarina sp. ERC-38]